MKEYNLAILGATGAVGQEFINLLNERDFPFKNLKLLASARSAGKELTVRGKTYKVEEAKADSFNGVDVALFAGGTLFGSAGIKLLSSKDAKNAYAHTAAAVLRMKDCVMTTVSTLDRKSTRLNSSHT